MFRVVATTPEGRRLPIGLWQERPEHALEDRDLLRAEYERRAVGWQVFVQDTDAQTVEWSHLDSSPTAGEAA